jgi:hypothetical protein
VEQKAFVFDFATFETELRAILDRALETGRIAELARFIGENLATLKDPYEGEPLADGWEGMLESADPHQYGDFALTKYYDPRADIGLGYEWERARDVLLEHLGNDAPLLGSTVGPAGNLFDPGKMGSYFQSAALVQANLQALRRLSDSIELAELERLRRALESAVGKGLYVTF